MKTLNKLVRSSMAMALLTFAFTLGAGVDARAQAGPLTVANSTPCTIWVQGQSGLGLTAGCTTPWIMVAPGTSVTIPPCSGPNYSWYHVHYGNCNMPGTSCPMGTTNSAVAACGMPTVMIKDCFSGGMYTPAWTGNNFVMF